MLELNDLLDLQATVSIRYFDLDRTTLMHEKNFAGQVTHTDAEQGIVLTDESGERFKVPPLLQACKLQVDGSLRIQWAVYRTQSERQDGQHEWWDWLPLLD